MLKKRAEIFLAEAKKVGLNHCPFRSGFFITIPVTENKEEIFKDLKSKKVFVLPIAGGIRVALCSVPCKKIKKLINCCKLDYIHQSFSQADRKSTRLNSSH